MSEDNHSYRLDPSDRINGLGQRRKRPKKVSGWTGFHMVLGVGMEQIMGFIVLFLLDILP